jgi:hypothetical protein
VFHDADTRSPLNQPAFTVVKNRKIPNLTVTPKDWHIWSFLESVFLGSSQLGFGDLRSILGNYSKLRESYRSHRWRNDDYVKLFMQDFLLDLDLWSSFGFEDLYEQGILSASHWQDMQNWSTERRIDDLESFVDPDVETEDEYDYSTGIGETIATGFQDGDEWLWYAARYGDTNRIRQHLSRRTHLVDASCLTVALQLGHIDAFWVLFSFGAAVQGDPTRWMKGPIFAAAQLGNLEAVQSLIQQANVHSRSLLQIVKLCHKPLAGAVSGGHKAIVSYFVSLGADVKSRGAQRDLMSHGHIVRYLLDTDVIPSRSYCAEQALRWTIERNDLEVFSMLLDYGVRPSGGRYYSSQRIAERLGRVEMLNLIQLKWGAHDENTGSGIIWLNRSDFGFTTTTSATEAEASRLLALWPPYPYFERNPYNRGLRATLKKTAHTFKVSDHCPLLARIKARERLATKARLREHLIVMHAKFLERTSTPDSSYKLSMFVECIGTAQKIWKRGFDAIRRLLNNQIPSNLQEVFSCVQLSRSMRSTIDELAEVEDPEPDEVFLAELDRWGLIVPDNERGVYVEIARVVWGKSGDTGEILEEADMWFREQETLEYFQKLMTSLISESHAMWTNPEMPAEPGGRRLSEIHTEFNLRPNPSHEYDTSRGSFGRTYFSPEDDEKGGGGGLLEEWKPASPMVILLTATTIFIVIIAFFLGEKYLPLSSRDMLTFRVQRYELTARQQPLSS